jgi:uncharacterized protein (DUF433 family)
MRRDKMQREILVVRWELESIRSYASEPFSFVRLRGQHMETGVGRISRCGFSLCRFSHGYVVLSFYYRRDRSGQREHINFRRARPRLSVGEETLARAFAAYDTATMLLTVTADHPPIREVGGALRVGNSHVTLEAVLWAFQHGSTPEDIADEYPSLALADVYAVVAYYLRHREDVDRYLDAQVQTYRATAAVVRRDFPQPDFSDRRRTPRARD